MALFARTLYSSSFAFCLDFLGQVLPVATHTEAMATTHRISLHVTPFVAANVAHEARNDFCPRHTVDVLPQARIFERLVLVIHVVFDQLFFPPPGVPEKDSRRLWGQTQDRGNLVDLHQLFPFNVDGSQDLKLDLVGFALLLQKVFVIRKAGVQIAKI